MLNKQYRKENLLALNVFALQLFVFLTRGDKIRLMRSVDSRFDLKEKNLRGDVADVRQKRA